MYPMMKRSIDVAVSGIALVLLWPVLLVVAVLIRVRLGSPILFKQTRPGLHGEPFTMFKFRTMLDGDAPDADRMTPFGTALRKTSLDELPELWNILKGDMSLVGPRPLLMQYLPLYTDRQATRHDVRPGLTGLAQVQGRNGLDWPTRLELDATYAESASFKTDLGILRQTIATVRSGEGVNAEGAATGIFLNDFLEQQRREAAKLEESSAGDDQ